MDTGINFRKPKFIMPSIEEIMPLEPKILHNGREVVAMSKAAVARHLLVSEVTVANMIRDGRLKPANGRADARVAYYDREQLEQMRAGAVQRLQLEASRLSREEQMKLLGSSMAEVQKGLTEITTMFEKIAARTAAKR